MSSSNASGEISLGSNQKRRFPVLVVVAVSILAFTFNNANSADAPGPATKRIHVIVALCDNEHQGIQKVGTRIGNGDDLENNLYWGCDDGLWRWFQSSKVWTLVESVKAKPKEGAADPWEGVTILETQTWRHRDTGALLVAEAWRGREIEAAMRRFVGLLRAPASDGPDLVAWIGHNGLMDFRLPDELIRPLSSGTDQKPIREGIVLCCLSRSWFQGILDNFRVRPVLLTEQLMYPGAFLLEAALEGWLRGENRLAIRERAARAYVKNQGISLKAALGVFTELE
ncbi:MAG: hypothetical protein KDM64_04735 [Verrucomicrobiae bacterium]|nr:hypothetical protein [Verrucomicrobiae bacterium]